MSEELDEIWALYADDGGQSLDGVEEALLTLKANAADGEAIAALFRAMHTFKGNSRLLGLTAIESCAHLAEDLIGLVRDDGVEIDDEFLALLLESADVLRAMMEATLSTRRDAGPQAAASISARMREKFERSQPGATASHSGSEPAEPGDEDSPFEFVESDEAVVFAPLQQSLAGDPLYRKMFLELANECLTELRHAHDDLNPHDEASKAAIVQIADRLHLAAEQIGIAQWPELARGLASTVNEPASVEAAMARMNELYHGELAALGNCQPGEMRSPEDEFAGFADSIEPAIEALIAAAHGCQPEDVQSPQDIKSFTDPIAAAAETLGYITLAGTAGRFSSEVPGSARFDQLLFDLYGDLKLIQELSASTGSGEPSQARPAVARLGAWCTAQGASILSGLRSLLAAVSSDADTPAIERLLRRLKLICDDNGAEIAGRVAMTLTDLISRIEPADFSAHPIVQQIETFIALAEPGIAAPSATQAFDATAMEGLLEKLTAGYSVVESARSVETRLGLPEHLQGCLTQSSAQAAQAALQAGKRFYIIRADLSANEDMAHRFIAWIEDGSAEVISSVTVFQAGTTVFDFLIASALEGGAVERGLGNIDPHGSALRLEMSLAPAPDTAANTPPAGAAMATRPDPHATSLEASSAMLDSIGELITGHSAMRQMVSDIEEEDLFALIEAELRNHAGCWNKARASVRSLLDLRQERAAELGQIQSQMAALLSLVQAEALSSRLRPASSLLDKLAAFGATNVRNDRSSSSIKTSGGGEAVDMALLQTLEDPLRHLVSLCLEPGHTADQGTAECVSISLVQNDDHVCVTVEKEPTNGATFELTSPATASLNETRRALRLKGGDLRSLKTPQGALSFRVTMPLATAVLEGMVVRVGNIRYVVPIHSIQRIVHSDSQDLIRVSAGNGQLMLKLSQDDVLPVSQLAGNGLRAADLLLAATAQNDNPLADTGKRLFVVAGNRTRRVALAIDELVGQQTVLLRPLKGYLSAIKDVTGCALLGSGGVGMVLDMRAILERD